MTDKDNIPEEIKKLGLCSTIHNIKSLGGGCISQASCYTTDRGDLFIKSNKDSKASQWFKAESLALERINEIVPGFAPKSIHYQDTTHDNPAFIVTEYIPMTNNTSSRDIQTKMGVSLAKLHLGKQSDKFGFDVTSFCGTTELNNQWNEDWCQFWCKQRMEPLFNQVRGKNRDLDACGKELCSRMEHWLGSDALPKIKPSLIHGDLWSGNWAIHAKTNQPVIFDPAAYYGHNEAEFGMMKMFGGVSQACFDAYDDTFEFSVIEGREERVMIYELYHHLNHYAMFGGSYGGSCLDIMERLL
ncbi:hypothetical protein G6F33_004724 [Rhizopus arrhizus]|nr:hypothetical protein G6F24_004435 [Rhizopus arrhizus]KAG0913927.1 hypothetical protein G6F33_004724 [Rhizopus arrhizus]KAG0956104.1 hypothetical protein G6F32_002289 [Rhizopus arrhizus]KAG1300207.1 hypothetical protein G6F66_000152 [Rhizopus arrhizus]